MANIVVLTNGNFFARVILSKLLTDKEHSIRVVIINGDYAGNSGLRALRHLARATALPYLVYKVFVYGVFKLARLVLCREWEVVDALRNLEIPYRIAGKVNAHEVESFIVNGRPDLIVSVSCPQRISKRLLTMPRYGSINIHSSLLPAFAGLAPYFWVLAKGERVSGTTIHYMNEEFDQGNILLQERFAIAAGISAFSLFHQLAVMGAELLPQAIALCVNGYQGVKQEVEKATYYSHPDWSAYLEMRRGGHRLLRLTDLKRAFSDQHIETMPNDLAAGHEQEEIIAA